MARVIWRQRLVAAVEFFAAPGREPVKLRLAVVFADSPLGGEQAAVFETMEGGVERALLDFEGVFGGVLDRLGDGVAVRGAHDEGAQDEHVQSSLEDIAGGWLFHRHGVVSTRMTMGRNILHSNGYGKG